MLKLELVEISSSMTISSSFGHAGSLGLVVFWVTFAN